MTTIHPALGQFTLHPLDTSPVTVTGTVHDAFEVTVNGVSAQITGDQFMAEAALQPGSNVLMVKARNAAKAAIQTVQVTYDPGAVTLQSIAITPTTASIPLGATQQVRAVGTYTNGQTADLTGNSTWMSSNSSVAIANAGWVTAKNLGAATITATFQGLTASLPIFVGPPTLQSIRVAYEFVASSGTVYLTNNPSLIIGETLPFKAFGVYSDGSLQDINSRVTWTSTSPSVATITGAGLATALIPGMTRITATDGPVTGSSTVTVSPSPLHLFITSPTDGSTVNASDVTITGTVLTQANEVGITVNGVPASVYGDRFVANGVGLIEGSNVITAHAVDGNGAVAEARIIIHAQTAGPQITLTSNIESGIAPLETTLTLDATFTIANSSVTYTGPGSVEFLSLTTTEYRVRMTSEGIYSFTGHVTDEQGNTYTDTMAITVLNGAQLDALLKGKWEGMKGALGQGDIEKALSYFTPHAQQKYRYVFEALRSSLPGIVSTLQPVRIIDFHENVVECFTNRIEDGALNAYFVYFVLDSNGLWKLAEM